LLGDGDGGDAGLVGRLGGDLGLFFGDRHGHDEGGGPSMCCVVM
jgi:hypothetical protein